MISKDKLKFYLACFSLLYNSKGEIVELRIPSNPNEPEKKPFIAFELHKKTYVPLYELKGNVTCLVDPEKQTIEESYRYSAFGEEKIYDHQNREIDQSAVGNPWEISRRPYR